MMYQFRTLLNEEMAARQKPRVYNPKGRSSVGAKANLYPCSHSRVQLQVDTKNRDSREAE